MIAKVKAISKVFVELDGEMASRLLALLSAPGPSGSHVYNPAIGAGNNLLILAKALTEAGVVPTPNYPYKLALA